MSASTIPLFGYAYELKVLTPPDAGGNQELINYTTDAWEPEALRITFDIEKKFLQNNWYGQIDIFNLSPNSEQNAIQVGSQVILSAGFQNKQNYGIIFSGQVLQPTWERVNATDYKVGLRCIIGQNYTNGNFINANIGRLSSQADFVRRRAAQARQPFQTDLVDFTALDQRKLPRGQVIFGNVGKILDEVAHSSDAQFWVAGDRPGLAKLNASMNDLAPDAIYAPPLPIGSSQQPQDGVTYSIIGTPVQTQNGVDLVVLMDARMDFQRSRYTVVEIDQSQIKQQAVTVGQGYGAVPFEKSGRYYVAGINHVGDSRGNDWFTKLTLFTSLAMQVGAN